MNKLIIFIASLFFISSSEASLLDYLKPALEKGEGHSMRNIDFIYMINLDRRPEKFVQSKYSLSAYGITPYRFSAINGWELTIDQLNDIGLKFEPGMTPLVATTFLEINGIKIANHGYMRDYGATYFRHCMPFGAIGCALSHISILKDAYESGYETIWVMEDDIDVIKDPHLIPELLDKLDELVGPENWDVLFTDFDYRIGVDNYLPASGACKRPDMDCSIEERYSDKYVNKEQISEDFHRVAARFGTGSMIIRRSGIIKLLEFSLKQNIFLPYDLENNLPQGIKRYGLMYDVVTNLLNSLSDIASPEYLKIIK